MESTEVNALDIQQEYYQNLLGCDWMKYEKCQRGFLRKNIAFALFGAPSSDGDVSDRELSGYTKRQLELVKKIYKKIREQKKYSLNNEDIVMSVLLVVCCKPRPLKLLKREPSNYWVGLHEMMCSSIVTWCTPVFRVRKCLPINGGNSCRVYVDENARVYQSWKKYLKNNTLPKCVLVVPENGEYRGILVEEKLTAKLSVVPSPALGPKARILKAVDTTSAVTSLGACGILVTAMFTPLAPAALTGAMIATLGTGVYSLVRSSLHLRNRKIHEQTIGVKNAEARACYINMAASTVGIASAGASKLLAKSVAAGTHTATHKLLKTSVEVLRYSNLVAGGGGLVNSCAHLIIKCKQGEILSNLELFQFAASTLFFANAVLSNRTAQSIITEAQNKTINDYLGTLRDEERKIFNEAADAARELNGHIQGNTEIIRGIRLIGDKEQYFSDIVAAYKAEGRNVVVPVGSNGKVILDAQCEPDSAEAQLSSLPLAQRVLSKLLSTDDSGQFVNIKPGELIRIGETAYIISTSGVQYIAELLEQLSEWAYKKLMLLCCNLLSNLPTDFQKELEKIFPDDDMLVVIVDFVFKYVKDLCGTRDGSKDSSFSEAIKDFFRDGRVDKERILQLDDKIREMCSRERARYSKRKEVSCKNCHGIYFE